MEAVALSWAESATASLVFQGHPLRIRVGLRILQVLKVWVPLLFPNPMENRKLWSLGLFLSIGRGRKRSNFSTLHTDLARFNFKLSKIKKKKKEKDRDVLKSQ